jgi:hypothetical protein
MHDFADPETARIGHGDQHAVFDIPNAVDESADFIL